MWIKERSFYKRAIFIINSLPYWSIENPRIIWDGQFKHQFTIHYWCQIVTPKLIVPFKVPTRFMQETWDKVPLCIWVQLWLQREFTPSYISRAIREGTNYGARPACSLDLNPKDFFCRIIFFLSNAAMSKGDDA